MSALWPNGSLIQPPLSDDYGPRSGELVELGARTFHYGVDIPLPLASPLVAARDAEVVFSDYNGTLGLQVVIDDGLYQFLYPHQLPGFNVPVGTKLRQGQELGRVGMTGLTTGPHTCFRTFQGTWRSDSTARDPKLVMAGYNTGTAGGGNFKPVINTQEEDMKVFAVVAAPEIKVNGTAMNGMVFCLSDAGIDYISAADWKNGGKTMANFYGGAQSIGDQPFSRACDAVGVTWKDIENAQQTGRFTRAGSIK